MGWGGGVPEILNWERPNIDSLGGGLVGGWSSFEFSDQLKLKLWLINISLFTSAFQILNATRAGQSV